MSTENEDEVLPVSEEGFALPAETADLPLVRDESTSPQLDEVAPLESSLAIETPATPTEDSLDFTLAYAKAGYTNSQDVIRFVDTKTGVMTGLVSIATVAPITLLEWSAGLDTKFNASATTFFRDHNLTAVMLTSGFAFGMLFGAFSILSSVTGLMARNSKRKLSYQGLSGLFKSVRDRLTGNKSSDIAEAQFSYLFPLYLERQEEAAREFFAQLPNGITKQQAAEEHARQLFQVGRILNIKISQNQKAVLLFKVQVVFYMAGILAALLSFWYGN